MQEFTLAAKRREQRDSLIEIGFRFTIMRVLADGLVSWVPSTKVSLESLKGTCCLFSFIAAITLAKALKLLLIAAVSFYLSPSVWVLSRRSEPARSIKLRVLEPSFIVKIEWLLDDLWLHMVSATTLLFSAFLSKTCRWSSSRTETHSNSNFDD